MLAPLRTCFEKAAAAQTALLVVDVQKRFCDPYEERGTTATATMARRIARLAPQFRKAGMKIFPVYFNRDFNLAPAQLDFYEFKPDADDKLTTKYYDSAFIDTKLAEDLRKNGIINVHICGFNLNACILKTALDTADIGFNTTVIGDMTGNDLYNTADPVIAARKLQDNNVTLARAYTILHPAPPLMTPRLTAQGGI